MSSSDFVIVLTTMAAGGDPLRMATTLVEEELAACVNVLAEMQSVYRWQDGIEQDLERQLVIKTTAQRVPALWKRVRELHPDEVPEFLVLPIVDGSEAYLDWLAKSTKTNGATTRE